MRSILISGAAQGIGAAIARLFYAHHYKSGFMTSIALKPNSWQLASAQMPKQDSSMFPTIKIGKLL